MRRAGVLSVVALAIGVVAAFPDARAQESSIIVFNGENNRLNAYDVKDGYKKQTVIPSAADTPEGKDINAQICFFPDGSRRFIAGEDTAQGDTGQPGWGIFQLQGNEVGNLSATQIGKLTTTFQTSDNGDERQPYESNPENFGCGFLSDGRVVTSDLGNQYPVTPNNGQLIIWFPPFDSYNVQHCKLDVGIPTAGGVHVDEQDRVYVASNRPAGPVPDRMGGIYRYKGPFPTSPAECTEKDPMGSPMKTVEGENFIPAVPVLELATPSAITPSGKGTYYVSSVFDGKIAEYDADGAFQRFILEPSPGLPPYDTGTPFGIGVDSEGSLYYADLGVVVGPPPGPGDGNGTVRRIKFVDGEPQAPELMDEGLAFPEGIGILETKGAVDGTTNVLGAQATQAQQPPAAAQPSGDGSLPATGGGAFPVWAAAAVMAACLLSRTRRLLTPTRT